MARDDGEGSVVERRDLVDVRKVTRNTHQFGGPATLFLDSRAAGW